MSVTATATYCGSAMKFTQHPPQPMSRNGKDRTEPFGPRSKQLGPVFVCMEDRTIPIHKVPTRPTGLYRNLGWTAPHRSLVWAGLFTKSVTNKETRFWLLILVENTVCFYQTCRISVKSCKNSNLHHFWTF